MKVVIYNLSGMLKVKKAALPDFVKFKYYLKYRFIVQH